MSRQADKQVQYRTHKKGLRRAPSFSSIREDFFPIDSVAMNRMAAEKDNL
jgi:hypothetical protein